MPTLPEAALNWDAETRKLAAELADLGDRWVELEPERQQIIKRRAELYLALDDRPGVSHSDIAALAKSTKGAVEQVLATQRRKAAAG